MSSRLSMHKQLANADFWSSVEWIGAVKPTIVKVISPDGDFCREVKRVSPGTLILARDIEDGGTAEDKWNRYRARSDYAFIDIIEGRNEVKPQLDDEGRAQASEERLLCQYALANGKKYCALSWGEGNPAEWWNDPKQWAEFLAIWGPVLLFADYIGLHEYWWPDWNTPAMMGWHVLRYHWWYPKLPADMQKPIIISEAGLDGDIGLLAPGKGWRDIYTPEQWAERFVAYEWACGPEVVAIEIYDFKPTPDWERFRWNDAADALKQVILEMGGELPMPVIPSIIDYRENVKAQVIALGGTGSYARRALSAIDTWVIHHVGAGDTGYPPDGIVRYHVQTLGWPGPGYHYFIGGDGKIYWLQDLENISYHCGDHNGHTVGICLAGNFISSRPTESQMMSLNWLTTQSFGLAWHLAPHRALSQTSCPGGDWYEFWTGSGPTVPPDTIPPTTPPDTVIARLEELEAWQGEVNAKLKAIAVIAQAGL